MQYAGEQGNYNGWSIENIQEQMMGVERKTPLYNMLIKQFSDAVDAEDYELAKNLYKKLLEMTHPESQERKIMKLDMEMIEPDDKTQ